jgi:hypothetical protein
MNFTKILLCTFLSAALMCCHNKENDPEPGTDPTPTDQYTYYMTIDSTLIKDFLFNKGTYWVYKDSITNAIDSIFCSGHKEDTIMYSSGGGMGSASMYTYFKYAYNLVDPNLSRYRFLLQGNFIRTYSPSYEVKEIATIENKVLKGDNLSSFFPSISINGIVYTDVYKLHIASPKLTGYSSGYYYVKKGIGIIKVDLLTNESVPKRQLYELLRYHIE